jgi:TRAP transporter TAXI family solute receptor
MAIVQSDIQAAALEGSGTFADAGPFGDLRAVMALHTEPLTVVAQADGGIDGLDGLQGARLGQGPEGSGDRALWQRVVDQLGWTETTFAETTVLAPGDQAQALCTDAVDAFVYAVGHPAQSVREATLTCDAHLVPVAGPAIDTLVASSRYYSDTQIAGGLYQGNPDPVPSFGVGATLVARADVPEDTVYTIVATALERIEMLRGLNPVLADLDPERMATAGLTAQLHPGAARAFRERGAIE